MLRTFLSSALALSAACSAISASAVETLICEADFSAAAVVGGSNSTAQGTYRLFGDEATSSVRVEITHNVASPTSIEMREGNVGSNSALLITNFGGATGSTVNYTLTGPEVSALVGASLIHYVVINDASHPSPGGAIRVDFANCGAPSEGEGSNEGTNEGGNEGATEGLPEGFGDYTCEVTLTLGQIVSGGEGEEGTPATGSGTLEISIVEDQGEIVARLQMVHNVPDATYLWLYSGAPGEVGAPVRRLAFAGGGLVLGFLPLSELEDFSTGHFFQLFYDPDGSGPLTDRPAIRGDIIDCGFDDGVPDPEGEGEGAEGEGEGQVGEGEGEGVVDCLTVPEGAPENLQCDVDLTGGAVVPPNSSPYEGRIQIAGPFPPDSFYVMAVRHNVPDVTSINIYAGAVGETGLLYDSLSTTECPSIEILPSNFLELLNSGPLYVEVASASGAENTIRADLLCFGSPEGEGEGDGSNEGSVDGAQEGEGDTDGEQDPLVALAEALLRAWDLGADANGNGRLETNEASGSVPSLTAQQFNDLNSDGNQGLTTGELHRYAGPIRLHTTDIDGDKEIDLNELLSAIQLYNSNNGYTCTTPPGADDGFQPGANVPGGQLPCLPHAGDYEGGEADFVISLTELLRIIQLFNVGNIQYCPDSSEDNFCIDL